jgi:hypothetical protein
LIIAYTIFGIVEIGYALSRGKCLIIKINKGKVGFGQPCFFALFEVLKKYAINMKKPIDKRKIV